MHSHRWKLCCDGVLMNVHVVVPARMASMRLPRKPLVNIAGVPMIVRVVATVRGAAVDSVTAAVDDVEVQSVVRQAGFDAVLTSTNHASGSDRVMEVVTLNQWSDDDIVINVQGDEPLLPAEIVSDLANLMRENPDIDLATLSEPIDNAADFLNPNIVKVVTDVRGDALYFSRAPIPLPRDLVLNDALTDSAVQALRPQRHVGVYGFRVAALRRFVGLQDSRLEATESLEQLRWLEAGGRIRVLYSPIAVPGGVDTPEDLARVEKILLAR